jgi:2-methylcitrate dehydratase PrpD
MLELDEGNQYARGHPAIHVVPALLAAPRGDGAALLVALALGYEMGARVGIASKLNVAMHPHGTWGTLGAAVGIAKLHGANAEEFPAPSTWRAPSASPLPAARCWRVARCGTPMPASPTCSA